ncbi:hypothetical protein ERJ75_000760800 [Trypanosoma vivax]|uniref:Uncharacterized protein n=1 Tax=Trypanosoma vivax (strain Y486) TaxID=1055687 RepID=G0TV68_TRYVY|nr:hypothetical protein TRVL_09625 [Trypanosoma vivax]KAH8613542.1 hypothetical protein ERJ75_000760800 [Trypanosoma vivax]CCC47834.1 conserved hypothetical protein, unlikely [Trypanosoma vivax Y486]
MIKTLISLFILVITAAFSATLGVQSRDITVDTERDEDLRYEYLSMLDDADLKLMLHEKGESFLHLETKEQLIDALIKLEQKEKSQNNVLHTSTIQHELRVEYCSG